MAEFDSSYQSILSNQSTLTNSSNHIQNPVLLVVAIVIFVCLLCLVLIFFRYTNVNVAENSNIIVVKSMYDNDLKKDLKFPKNMKCKITKDSSTNNQWRIEHYPHGQ